MKDFRLELSNPPGGVYFPGMTVTGRIITINDEPRDYKAIQVKLVGEGNVRWTETRGRVTSTYSSSEKYLERHSCLWDKEETAHGGLFPVGSFQFPFALKLIGEELPATYNDGTCKITYRIEARVVNNGIFKRDITRSSDIRVRSIIDINYPHLLQPKSMEVRKTICCLCCASGPIVITATIPRTGYCIQKDRIPLEVSVENGSNRRIMQIIASICRTIEYTAQWHEYTRSCKIATIASATIRPNRTTVWCPAPLPIPITEPSIDSSDIIDISYSLRIVGVISFATNMAIDIPLYLGNLPLASQGAPAGETTVTQAQESSAEYYPTVDDVTPLLS